MKKWLKIAGSLAVIGIIAAILLYIFVYNKPHPKYEKLKPEYVLEARELYKSFSENSSIANQKYTGKMIQVEGELNEYETVDSLVIAVFIFEEGLFGGQGIRCTMLPNYNEEIIEPGTGSAVKIKGLCTGYNDTDVILEYCSLVKDNLIKN
jgi:hypothetical protein